ncbi:tyrosine-protein phosphatase non-receptor type 6 [Westerdykella ornata]|uniref:protein-tyrosine-phosphatase n=1 Tax=Westerdykella ornata TaxID=318751 RepID=A0A6A6JBY9_WESOR|nr:tyrosine-protein phosphatase non-receptor type 6 [Westerdykella ornata]KAF2274130.1 tyrosine-protein phosphatase non-receptor type 6 [Westerdykella ornata]
MSAPLLREASSHSSPHIKDPRTPAPVADDPCAASPSYFGVRVDGSDHFASGTAHHVNSNWCFSPNVRSIAAASPRIIPVDHNPEFKAFKRQSEANKGFALGGFDFSRATPSTLPKGPFFQPIATPNPSKPVTPSPQVSPDCVEAPKPQRSPKRLLSSTEPQLLTDHPRRESPASFLDQEGFGRTDEVAQFADTRHATSSLPPPSCPAILRSVSKCRADTLPATPDQGSGPGPTLASPQHVVNILESAQEQVLLLDLRVSTHYAKSHINGALSLCIPTTLLKRASFNVSKLAETFKNEEDRDRFERWRSCKSIIVYDANSSHIKDAMTCTNTLKKFINEGWTGGSYIIRGGFTEFSATFPCWVTQGSSNGSASPSSSLQIGSDRPAVAPVVGGCPMPAAQSAANPFFGNIRQNMDLIGGVGQMAIKQPAGMTKSVEEELPQWLKGAADEKDRGKLVSDKFLHIEKREQKRMQEAFGNVVYSSGADNRAEHVERIQIAGLEKGSKNRYNNIWPYEHSRVKLEGVAKGDCDYVNANYIKPSLSNKRYIATQGPLPATFNDFWNVVWQQDVRVIVMLTAEQEGGQAKAHNYWSERQYGHLFLNPLGEHRASLEPHRIRRNRDPSRAMPGQRRSTNPPKPTNLSREASHSSSQTTEQPYVTVRKFTLSNSDEPFERMREITQLQYSHWPDFGAPAHPAHLLGLIEQCDAVVRQVNGGSASQPDPPNTRPVLVHCSAGCGRTGTFCTVDSVIDMLKRQRQARNARQARSSAGVEVADQPPSSSDSGGVEGNWTLRDDVDLIEKTVEDFRAQRLSMVQSLRQFVLCYECVLEWLVEQHPKSA